MMSFLLKALFLVPSGPSMAESGMVSFIVSSYCSSFYRERKRGIASGVIHNTIITHVYIIREREREGEREREREREREGGREGWRERERERGREGGRERERERERGREGERERGREGERDTTCSSN